MNINNIINLCNIKINNEYQQYKDLAYIKIKDEY